MWVNRWQYYHHTAKLGTLCVKSYRRVVLAVRTYACWVVRCQGFPMPRPLNPVDRNRSRHQRFKGETIQQGGAGSGRILFPAFWTSGKQYSDFRFRSKPLRCEVSFKSSFILFLQGREILGRALPWRWKVMDTTPTMMQSMVGPHVVSRTSLRGPLPDSGS